MKTGAAGAPMTMADATRFADNALEHVVHTLLAALSARAILESTQGALRWDGLQYEKKYRRLLSPPLQRLLTQPGALLLTPCTFLLLFLHGHAGPCCAHRIAQEPCKRSYTCTLLLAL